MGNRSLNQLVKILIVCGMVAGCFFSCIILREMGMEVDRLSVERCGSHVLTCFAVGLGLLFVAGAMVIAVTLLQMMRSLDQEPFVMKNVRALRRMGFVALGMAACCLLLLLLPANTIMAQLVGAAVGMCGLFSLVLAQVFERAVACKQENDLTV